VRILIVDDNVPKAGKLVALLVRAGIKREDVEVVVCAMTARERLKVARYDLLVLDLLLPLREEDAPSVETSIDLIVEIGERDAYFKPKHIVGFTAFAEAETRAINTFRQRLWTIVQFDPLTTDWEVQFSSVAEYLMRQGREPDSRSYETDLCVVAALPLEAEAMHALPWDWCEPEPLDDMTFVRKGIFLSHGQPRTVVAACAPRMGSVAAALLTLKLVEHFRPRFVVMPGICAGVKDKVKIGDTVLMDPVWEWPSGKLAEEEDGGTYLQPAPHQIPLSEFVAARAGQLRNDRAFWDQVAASYEGRKPVHSLALHIGPGASGSAVVADGSTVEAIKAQHRKLLAVEMEAYGVYAAARTSASPRPTALAMKTVCDFADEAKADTWQKLAAHVSSQVVAEFFQRYMSEMSPLAGS